eukprot:4837148-Prymnesium_polylepis.1
MSTAWRACNPRCSASMIAMWPWRAPCSSLSTCKRGPRVTGRARLARGSPPPPLPNSRGTARDNPPPPSTALGRPLPPSTALYPVYRPPPCRRAPHLHLALGGCVVLRAVEEALRATHTHTLIDVGHTHPHKARRRRAQRQRAAAARRCSCYNQPRAP